MSVLKSKRQESPFEVFVHARKMRRAIIELACRDFGYKPKEKPCETEAQRTKRLNCQRQLLDKEMNFIFDILRYIMRNITMANKIFPTNASEYEARRLYQDKAIAACIDLQCELQCCIEDFALDVNIFFRYEAIIQKEISLLKAWRKADNKFKNKF